MRHFLLIGFLILQATLGMAQDQAKIPERFHGKWAGNQSECRRPSESTLYIAENQFEFWESRGPVRSVKSVGTLEIEVELESTGERSTWRDSRRFRLSQDGRTLTDFTRDKYHIARIRCETAQKGR
jgi:hypothetical protein